MNQTLKRTGLLYHTSQKYARAFPLFYEFSLARIEIPVFVGGGDVSLFAEHFCDDF
jgi:hypothetical protein